MSYDAELSHYGIKRKSGRYPWGSGGTELARAQGFNAFREEMKRQGITSQTEVAKIIEDHINAGNKPGERRTTFSSTDLRATISNSTEAIRDVNRARATQLKAKGMSNAEIAVTMGLKRSSESTVRGWLEERDIENDKSIKATAQVLRDHLVTKPFLDVGKGTHLYMGISAEKLKTAVASLKDEGYQTFPIKLPQLGTNKPTEYKVLTAADKTFKDARDAVFGGRVQNVTDHSEDGGKSYLTPSKLAPISLSSKRLEVRYKGEGGEKMDGVIELRRNVEDLSLNGKNYAQIRMAVDKSHYLKGMAMYADDLPPGVDVRFNTNKTRAEAPGLKSLKPLKTIQDKGVDTGKVDNENPFGATTYPRVYKDSKGKEHTSPLNIVNEEGRWDDWSRALSSQMLSKQSIVLANTQLRKAQQTRQDELDRINSLTNPVVKKKLLDEFADSADSAAVHLKAAALPRQTNAVLLPINSIRPHEVYAPNHEHGEKLVLVRHPHGGPFEIPELTNNLRNLTAKRILGSARDAIAIHHSVAEQLSGADFDGDTVLVIPNHNKAVKTRPPLEGLKGFDAKKEYGLPEDDHTTPRMKKSDVQREMGQISNLITDMSIHKANDDELARAVKHSMVVIDAYKHGLDYKRSAEVNNIKQLKERYQKVEGSTGRGASTIISRASSQAQVLERKQLSGKAGVNPKTGEKVFVDTGRTYVDKNGVTKPYYTKGTKAEFAKDARDLLSNKKSPQPMESVYAEHSNTMKALANEARKLAHPERLRMPKESPLAKKAYAPEVASLNAKLKEALRNAPLERKAQSIGRFFAQSRIDSDPSLDKDDIKKIKYQELERARLATGAAKKRIGAVDEHGHSTLTEREWEAIQSHAISPTKLREILANADMDRVRELAAPRASSSSLTPGQIALAKQLVASKRPLSEIAERLGVPRSTLSDNLAKK